MPVAEIKRALPGEAEGPGIAEYLGVFRRRPKTILMPILLMTAFAGVIAYLIPPRYRSSTQLKVNDPGSLSAVRGGSQNIIPHKDILATIKVDIVRPRFYRDIVARLGLNEGFNLNDPEELAGFYDYISDNLIIDTSFAKAGSDIIGISYQGRDPQKVADFVQQVSNEYRAYFRNKYRSQAESLEQTARLGLEEHTRHLAELEADYDAFRQSDDYRLIGFAQELRRRQTSLEEMQNKLSIELKQRQGEQSILQARLRSEQQESVTFNKIQNPEKLAIKTKLDEQKAILNQMIARGLTDLTGTVQDQRALITQIQKQYADTAEWIDGGQSIVPNKTYENLVASRDDVSAKINGLELSLKKVEEDLATVKTDMDKVPELDVQEYKFKQEIDLAAQKVKFAEEKYQTIEIEWKRIKSDGGKLFEIMESPRATDPAIFPSIPLFLGLGAAVGLLLGIGIAFLREFSGMTYTSAAQVQSTLPLPILGEVGRIQSEEEKRSEAWRRRVAWSISGLIVVVVGFLHLFYFHDGLSKHLPPMLAQFMDLIYRGR
ncbi:MAG: hypothetical protein KDB53_07605 [Planctomycetes bacterium]|nr:hypothetical protein [Planctomycetota bacterium]